MQQDAIRDEHKACREGLDLPVDQAMVATRAEGDCSAKEITGVLVETEIYDVAARFATDVCRLNGGDTVSAAQFKVMDFVPVKFSERHSSDARWGAVTEVVFPEIPLGAARLAQLDVAMTPTSTQSEETP